MLLKFRFYKGRATDRRRGREKKERRMTRKNREEKEEVE